MVGDEKVRFCNSCQKNVYDLSELSPKQAVDLLEEKDYKLCVRVLRRNQAPEVLIRESSFLKRFVSVSIKPLVSTVLALFLGVSILALDIGASQIKTEKHRKTKIKLAKFKKIVKRKYRRAARSTITAATRGTAPSVKRMKTPPVEYDMGDPPPPLIRPKKNLDKNQ